MSEQTSPTAGDGWGFTPIGTDNIPTHCGGLAFDEGHGDWACAACPAAVHVRAIPDWTPRTDMLPGARVLPVRAQASPQG